MNNELKPGMLAIVVPMEGVQTKEIIGRIVEIVRPAYNGEIYHSIKGRICAFQGRTDSHNCWVITSNSPLPWTGLNGVTDYFHERAIFGEMLKPLNGTGLGITEDEVNELYLPSSTKEKRDVLA